jgi:folate-dependent phosphoribosylglycinamide formyltransferase PurN
MSGFAILTKADSTLCKTFLFDWNIKPDLLVVEVPTLFSRYKRARFLARQIGIIDTIRYNIPFFWRHIKQFKNYKRWWVDNVKRKSLMFVEDINGKNVENELKRMGIDKIILCHAPVVRSNILKCATTINAHPGDLPEMRGVDNVKWSLYFMSPPACTLHEVDSGIDTGIILHKEFIPLHMTDRISDIQNRASNIGLQMLADYINGEQFSKTKQGGGVQHYLMPKCIVEQLERNLPIILKYLGGIK